MYTYKDLWCKLSFTCIYYIWVTNSTLWTNPNNQPNNFSNQTATLSQGISNFTFIKFHCRHRETPKVNNVATVIYFDYIWEPAKLVEGNGSGYAYSWTTMANYYYDDYSARQVTVQRVQYISDTEIKFASNSYICPISIIGIKWF